MGHGAFSGAHCAVVDLERHAEAQCWQRRGVDAFGSVLDTDRPRSGQHGLGREPARAVHEKRLRRHGVQEAARGLGPAFRQPGRIGKPRHSESEAVQRHAIHGDAAAIAAQGHARKIAAGHSGQRLRHPLLRRMTGLDIAPDGIAAGNAGGEKARVLARAIVIGGGETGSIADGLLRRPGRARRLHAAFEAGSIEADTREPSLDRRDMPRLALMRCTSEREFALREIEAAAAPVSISGSACRGFVAERG